MNEVRQLAGDGGVGSPFSVFHDVQVNPKGARMNGARNALFSTFKRFKKQTFFS